MNHNNERRPARRSKSVYRGLKAKTSPILWIVIGILAAVIIVLLVIIAHMSLENVKNRPPENLSPGTEESAPETEDDFSSFGITPSVYTLLTIDNKEIRHGDLLLVNRDNAYTFPEDDELIPIYGNSNSRHYSPRDASLSLKASALDGLNAMMEDFYGVTPRGDILIRYAYMTKKDQSDYYDRRLEAEGYTAAEAKYEKPGYSDHHTGLAVDLAIFRGGATYEFDGLGDYAWILQNCADYGFILRYPDGKSAYTGIAPRETAHLRYVGAPHSVYITTHGLCLEEYIELLKEHTVSTEPLRVAHGGVLYEVYYCPAAEGTTTEIPVPEGETYTVSGNNVDGFIVTVTKEQRGAQ